MHDAGAAGRWLAALLLASAALAARANTPLPLHLLDATAATARGAVCLDGSPPGFYYGAARGAPENAHKWLLFFRGGGWCVSGAGGGEEADLRECLARSRTALGSTSPERHCHLDRS